MIQLDGSSVLRVRAPRGWSSGVWSHQSILDFAATEGDPPPDWVADGNLYPSPFQIKPGRTLSGFSFDSPDPPGPTDFHVQGFTRLPEMGVDEDEIDVVSPLDPSQSFRGRTKGPRFSEDFSAADATPAVDGFVAFRKLPNQAAPPPLQVDVAFGINGEVVDESTFRATLNNHDVTADFQVTGEKTRRATFPTGHPWLKRWKRNVLVTVVDGVVAGGKARVATDVDRVTITVR